MEKNLTWRKISDAELFSKLETIINGPERRMDFNLREFVKHYQKLCLDTKDTSEMTIRDLVKFKGVASNLIKAIDSTLEYLEEEEYASIRELYKKRMVELRRKIDHLVEDFNIRIELKKTQPNKRGNKLSVTPPLESFFNNAEYIPAYVSYCNEKLGSRKQGDIGYMTAVLYSKKIIKTSPVQLDKDNCLVTNTEEDRVTDMVFVESLKLEGINVTRQTFRYYIDDPGHKGKPKKPNFYFEEFKKFKIKL